MQMDIKFIGYKKFSRAKWFPGGNTLYFLANTARRRAARHLSGVKVPVWRQGTLLTPRRLANAKAPR